MAYVLLEEPKNRELVLRGIYMSDYTGKMIIDKARGQWPGILQALGVDANYLKNKHGPCLICGGKDRFRFDDKDGRGTFYCNQCGAGDGIQLLRIYHGWDFLTAIEQISCVLGISVESRSHANKPRHIGDVLGKVVDSIESSQADSGSMNYRRRALEKTWQETRPITFKDPVDGYFQARGIKLSDFPRVLRFHPSLPYYDDDRNFLGFFPALVALVQDTTGQGITLHRTYLGDACKADVPEPKKIMSPVISGATNGAAIKLYEPIDGQVVLAEGIETAFAIYVSTQLPVWATVSANGMERVVLPSHVKEVMIAIDNDVSGRGQKAGSKLAERLLSEGRKVTRIMPHKVGSDFANLLVEKSQ